MSAWVMNDQSINALVTFWGKHCSRSNDAKECQQTGEALLSQNIKSVNYRYNERSRLIPESYFYTPVTTYQRKPITNTQIAKLVLCWKYQACEDPKHKRSKAWEIIEEISDELLRQSPGYEQADWGLD